MTGERGAALLAVAGDQIEDTWWQMPPADLRHLQQRERRVLGGLEHQGVACGHGHRDLERAEHDRSVPWHYRADDSDRLAACVAEHVLAQWNRFALELAGQAAEVPEHVRGAPDFRARLRPDGVAGLEREHSRDRFEIRVHGVGNPDERPAAIPRSDVSPLAERASRGVNRGVHVGVRGARHAPDDRVVGRVFDVDERAVGALARVSAYEHQRRGDRLGLVASVPRDVCHVRLLPCIQVGVLSCQSGANSSVAPGSSRGTGLALK